MFRKKRGEEPKEPRITLDARTVIAPTITAETAEEYKRQMLRISKFTSRVHIDVADGELAPVKLIPLEEVWWPSNVHADLHLMYQKPLAYAKLLAQLQPDRVIVHAEADGDFVDFAEYLQKHNIRIGVALLPGTHPQMLLPVLKKIDHVLIFSGNLGHQGGKADLKLLKKIHWLREHKPSLEISWDGGINDTNTRRLLDGGIDVLNVGGFIGKAVNPQAAYVTLEAIVNNYELPQAEPQKSHKSKGKTA